MVPAVLACPQPCPGPDRWAEPLETCVIYFQSTLWLCQHHSRVGQYGRIVTFGRKLSHTELLKVTVGQQQGEY